MTDTKLRIENLTKTFGDETAVSNLSTTVQSNKLHSMLGPSGCGKTTTLRCVAGLENPDSGRIYIDDELVSAPQDGIHVKPKDRGIGMVFQEYAVWPHLTVEQNVVFPLEVQDIGTKQEREQKVNEILSLVGLEEYGNNLSTNLSGGQQQRVAISRALVTEPEILLFDEPLSNLDAKLRREMRLEIERICDELDITVLYVTHDQDEAMYLSDKITLLENGTLTEENDPVSLHTNPNTFFGMTFMGQCNIVSGTIESIDSTIKIQTPETSIDVPEENLIGNFRSGQEVHVCFRPKFCRFGTQGDDADVTFSGRVRKASPTRDFTEYDVQLDSINIQVRLLEPIPITPGDHVDVTIDSSQIRVYPTSDGPEMVTDTKVAVTPEAS